MDWYSPMRAVSIESAGICGTPCANIRPDTNTIGSAALGAGDGVGAGGDVGVGCAGGEVGVGSGVSDGGAPGSDVGVGVGVGAGSAGKVREKLGFMTGMPPGWYVSVSSACTSPRKNVIVCPANEASAATDRAAYIPFPPSTITGFDS